MTPSQEALERTTRNVVGDPNWVRVPTRANACPPGDTLIVVLWSSSAASELELVAGGTVTVLAGVDEPDAVPEPAPEPDPALGPEPAPEPEPEPELEWLPEPEELPCLVEPVGAVELCGGVLTLWLALDPTPVPTGWKLVSEALSDAVAECPVAMPNPITMGTAIAMATITAAAIDHRQLRGPCTCSDALLNFPLRTRLPACAESRVAHSWTS